jgi:hypothetical protein
VSRIKESDVDVIAQIPIENPGEEDSTATGRSSKGCITYRRRREKCDEAKPTCECIISFGFPP